MSSGSCEGACHSEKVIFEVFHLGVSFLMIDAGGGTSLRSFLNLDLASLRLRSGVLRNTPS